MTNSPGQPRPDGLPRPSDGLTGTDHDPDERGYFGSFGGRWLPEALVGALDEVADSYRKARRDPEFLAELDELAANYAGRPSPLTDATRLTAEVGGARILLKREDLNHTGSHKINNVLGQALLAKRMGKTRVIAETGAGQHGVATATAAALLGLECSIYMGRVDTERQAPNVARMRLLGAEVIAVDSGSSTLKDAINEAFRDWVTNVGNTFYLFGTVGGPHPFPVIVRDFQRIIGLEARVQMLERTGRLPDAIAACVGGGSNAIGIFHAFLDDPGVRLVGMEAGGDGIETGRHASTISGGTIGVLHGARSFLLQDEDGQIIESHSISAGLDYPGVGPEHSHLAEIGRAEYRSITDTQAMDAFLLLSRTEGIIPAIESAHAVAGAVQLAREIGPDGIVLINVSGRGDKDMETAMNWFKLGEPNRETGGVTPGEAEPIDVNAGDIDDRWEAASERPRAHVRRPEGAGPGGAGLLPAGRLPQCRGLQGAVRGRADDGGCDLVEVGLPFSDPALDGPVIQHATQQALAGGFRTRDAFGIVESITGAGGRAVVMTYFNPVLAYGVDRFAADLAAAGGSGVITPDLIVDEAGQWLTAARRQRPRSDLPGRAVVVGGADRADRRGHQRVPLCRVHHGRHRGQGCGVPGGADPGGPLPGDHRPAARRRARGADRGAGRRDR